MNQAQENLLFEAKLFKLRLLPYFGTYIIGMDLIEDNNIPTACTDMRTIRFNTKFLLGGEDGEPLSKRSEVVFCLAHEVLHISFKHGIRMGYRDPSLWNVACDYAVNQILVDGEIGEYPSKAKIKLVDEKFRDMSAEEIYDILEKERQKQGGGDKFKHGGVVIDLSKKDPGGLGGFERPVNVDGSGLTPSQQAALERAIDAQTSAAAASAKQQGKLPAGLERFLHKALQPEVDWRDRLRQFVARTFPTDLSWQRPNKRHIWQDIYLPHVEKSGVGEILCIMDTSGSIDFSTEKSEGSQFYAEIKAIFEDVAPEKLHVMYCDAEVAGHDVFDQGQEPTLKPRGGGGTDFRPPFQKVEKDGLRIQCAIYLTDMYGTFPEEAPEYPVMWVATSDVKAPFGDTIRIMK